MPGPPPAKYPEEAVPVAPSPINLAVVKGPLIDVEVSLE